MVEIEEWKKFKIDNMPDTIITKLINSKNVTISKVQCKAPENFKSHSHTNEQITYVLTGEAIVTINCIQKVMKAGDICIIKPNEEHSSEIIKCPFEALDVFTPCREEYVNACF